MIRCRPFPWWQQTTSGTGTQSGGAAPSAWRFQSNNGRLYVIPVDIDNIRGDLEQSPPSAEFDEYVSIDGRKTYFNLFPTETVDGNEPMVQATALPKPAPVKILNKSFLWTWNLIINPHIRWATIMGTVMHTRKVLLNKFGQQLHSGQVIQQQHQGPAIRNQRHRLLLTGQPLH